MSEHRCSGDCCRDFPLTVSPARLGELYANARILPVLSEFERDVIFIAEMIVELPGEADEDRRYTCRHFDATKGLCRVYDQRPAMCRNYPEYDYGGSCGSCGAGCSGSALQCGENRGDDLTGDAPAKASDERGQGDG